MIGQAGFLQRLRGILPAGWFTAAGDTAGTAATPTPVLDAILAGFAALFALVEALLQFARNQTRLGTSTDGFLELAALDYFGTHQMPRIVGELDASYAARLQMALLPHANLRQVISDAVEAVTGQKPRLTEPWNPGDTGVIDGVWGPTWDDPSLRWDTPGLNWDQREFRGGIFLDVDTPEMPARLTNPGLMYQGFCDTVMPTVPLLGGNPVPCLDDGFYLDSPGSALFDFPGSVPLGAQLVYDAINKVKPLGVVIWVRFAA